ncbi:MAG: hypothetical protein V1685_03545 [Parcubacteria group bacterium]
MMTSNRKLAIVSLTFAIAGSLLSGYLTYWNLIGPSCHQGPLNWLVSCGGPKKVLLLGLPTCVYGFAMFLTVFLLSAATVAGKPKKSIIKALITLGVIGTLFSSTLIVYEIWILKLTFTGLPACVYGLLFYLGILITNVAAYRRILHEPVGT